jgi:hypothetical protein
MMALAIVGVAAAGYAATTLLDAVLAEVDGAIITASDATIARALGLFGTQQSEKPIRTADVSHLVDAWLIDAEAARLQIAPSVAEFEDAWRTIAGRVGGMDALRSWLDRAGLDEAWVKRLVEADLRGQRFVDVRFRAFVFVTEEDVTKALGPGPHTVDARGRAVDALREEAAKQELAAWLADARTRAAIRTTGAEGTGLPLLFPPPAPAGTATTAPR